MMTARFGLTALTLMSLMLTPCQGFRSLALLAAHPPPGCDRQAAAWRQPHHATAAVRPLRRSQPLAQVGTTLESWLEEGPSCEAHSVILALCGACRHVASKIATASCDSTCCFNELDDEDELLAIDLLAEEVLFEALERTGQVAIASSESDQVQRSLAHIPPPLDPSDHNPPPSPPFFSVALDPLDASSIIDSNFAVGTIFAVWAGPSLRNVTGRQLVAAGACTYGPRTAITLALADRPAVNEFLLVRDRWMQSNVYDGMETTGQIFAPGNLRATASNPRYKELVDYWQQSQYTLRYTGGLVPDVTQLLVKGKGVFVSAAAADERPRLRLLYESVPMAFLIEKAGGASSDGARSLLDVEISESDERTHVALGSHEEVRRFEQVVGAAAMS